MKYWRKEENHDIMLDFLKISTEVIETKKKSKLIIYPEILYKPSKDMMVLGGDLYGIWDEDAGFWKTSKYDFTRLVDKELQRYLEDNVDRDAWDEVVVKWTSVVNNKNKSDFFTAFKAMPDSYHQLDDVVMFSNTESTKDKYATAKLPYSLEEGDISAYDELMSRLYDEKEREKLEWAVGSIIAGDSRTIQKFIVIIGEPGTGKSTFLNMLEKLFEGYFCRFNSYDLGSVSASFATAAFKDNKLVGIEQDGDLSRIEVNTKLNSIVSHEGVEINEKYKAPYYMKINTFLFSATNGDVKITDMKSGIIRRLISVRTKGVKIPQNEYQALFTKMAFELGAIAQHCKKIYLERGKHYYDSYVPLDMLRRSNYFYNFVEDYAEEFMKGGGISLKQAYTMYKEYCQIAGIQYPLTLTKARDELKTFFIKFYERKIFEDGTRIRSYFEGFKADKLQEKELIKEMTEEQKHGYSLTLECDESLFDKEYADCLAQYANSNEVPKSKWSNVKTTLKDINTKEVHYVRIPENHIVIDFDIKDENGNKSLQKNMEAASKWPATYAEFSKSGSGIHLHYIYDGDPTMLSRIYGEDIEIKVFNGNSSLRRKFSKCNNLPIVHISSGLPIKEKKTMINFEGVKTEQGLRKLIERNLRKEIHPGTKPSVDFIKTILDEAYNKDMKYDITDMRPKILAFANNSTHQSDYCLDLVNKMKWKSDEPSNTKDIYKIKEYVFFDVEVFPNLFVIVYKIQGKDPVRMINPDPKDIEPLLSMKLIGYNCRRYDNHIIYARYIGYSLEELFKLSQKIINNSKNCMFAEAYNLSYADIYDFSTIKQSLKKFELELGMHHQENEYAWDQPVPEDKWDEIVDYCVNDVEATEATFEDRKEDFKARQILAKISGLKVNDSVQSHTARIIFGYEKEPQKNFIYTDLATGLKYGPGNEVLNKNDKDIITFNGYKFDAGHSWYRDEDPGEGGYVYAEPGMYGNVALLDIASMHPSSMIAMDIFGPYTSKFKELMDARLAIKHKEFDKAKKMFDGALEPFLTDESESKELAYALKIVINSVYGFTSAKFPNKFKDNRNVDNIVAKRGALFMIELKHKVQDMGYTVAHVKTDSIKIPDADEKIIQFVMDFGKKYGYTFEHEATYEKLCLVNESTYIAKDKSDGKWTATGAQFQVPYVFKTLFSKEKILFEDKCEIKTVTSSMYLDFNENLGEDEHAYHFVGKAGKFCPVKDNCGGGILLRKKDDKYYAVTSSLRKDKAKTPYRWLESEIVRQQKIEKDIDLTYYNNLVDEAVEEISKYGNFEWFASDEPYINDAPFAGGKKIIK